jgi:hypothetical protein
MTDHVANIFLSIDGGHTFGAMTTHDLGNTGSFVKEVKRTRMGQSKQFVFKFSVSSPVKCPILATAIQAEVTE